jgi:7,8-dihydropterin-6-yl-methyl-4-(beta-D-ribofuranosyl)aminobenzene 5'-phosphate synthase
LGLCYLVERVTVRVLVENSASLDNPELVARHGLSIMLEVVAKDFGQLNILLDTGPSAEVTITNAHAMGVDLSKIDIIVINHGHGDHAGGLADLLTHLKKRVPVAAHPEIFSPKLKTKPFPKAIGPRYLREDVERAGGVLVPARNPVALASGVLTTGEIERVTPFERPEGFRTVSEGSFKEDLLVDDQALAISIDGKGLAVISGCAHSDIVNSLTQAKKVTGESRVHAVIGGFHLEGADEARIGATVRELARLEPALVCPSHCAGFKAMRRIAEVFEERCRPLRTGDVLQI